MEVNSRASTEVLIPKKWKERSNSPERIKIWIETKVPVVYYLSRNGHLLHPHFIEVPLSSPHQGLYLRDVISRMNSLRGKGMASMYSWSSKRSYKNGYVWQDLSENDLIYPTKDNDYVLKGSELLQTSMSFRLSSEKASFSPETRSDAILSRRKKNQSWGSFENAEQEKNENRVAFKSQSNRELGLKFDAATQTAAERRRARSRSMRERSGEEVQENKSVELSRGELSPPRSMSSSEGVTMNGSKAVDRTAKMKASQVLMHFITCGSSIAVKDCGPIKSRRSAGAE